MTMNKKKAARRRGDAGHRFSVARVPALLATALGALALPAWAQDAGHAGDTAQTQDDSMPWDRPAASAAWKMITSGPA